MRARRKALTQEERELAAKAVCARLLDDGDIMEAADPFYAHPPETCLSNGMALENGSVGPIYIATG